eukprot:scaffold185564_cov50-Attheya_sp.AAC.3
MRASLPGSVTAGISIGVNEIQIRDFSDHRVVKKMRSRRAPRRAFNNSDVTNTGTLRQKS